MKKAVVLLSGGLDSSTVLAMILEQGYSVNALTVSYGQRNKVELIAAQKMSLHFKVHEHKFLDIDLSIFGGSSLTDNIDVLAHEQQNANEIPNTYVPARNTILLSLALAYAEVSGANDIFYGANVHDYSGYPDCRPAYLDAFNKMANLATKSGTLGNEIRILAPLMNLNKAQIIKRGTELNVPYELSHSCYNPEFGLACGSCSACFYRQKGFSDANISDPTRYASADSRAFLSA
jgi:7-cyano-7-deazaguanine synthase